MTFLATSICSFFHHCFLFHSQTSPCFNESTTVQVFENTMEKGEIGHNEQFLLFPQGFLPIEWSFFHLMKKKKFSANFFSLEEFKICCLVKGYILFIHGYYNQRLIIDRLSFSLTVCWKVAIPSRVHPLWLTLGLCYRQHALADQSPHESEHCPI